MAVFDVAIVKVLNLEGGYSGSPTDDGNYYPYGDRKGGKLIGTMRGITPSTYKAYYGFVPTVAQIKDVTIVAAKNIYKELFWNKIQGAKIHNQSVADIFMDGVVQHGRGVKLMQEVLNVDTDGVVGKQTLTAINSADPQWLFNAYKQRRIDYYKELAKDPKNENNLLGWLSRMNTWQWATIGLVGVVTFVTILFFLMGSDGK